MAERNTNKLWWGVLGGLLGVILILVVAIFVVKNLNQKPDDNENLSLIEQAQNSVDNIDGINVPEAIEVYQAYIDQASGETKVELLMARVNFVWQNDIDMEYKEQVIRDLEEMDGIVQTPSSAVQVLNFLYYYDDAELIEKYEYILNQRNQEEGGDESMETIG